MALAQNTSYRDALRLVREARAAGLKAPVILMGYVNPIMSYGEEAAVKDAKARERPPQLQRTLTITARRRQEPTASSWWTTRWRSLPSSTHARRTA